MLRLGLCILIAEDLGSIPGWGTEIAQALWCGKKIKLKKKNTVNDSWEELNNSIEKMNSDMSYSYKF